MQSPFPLPEQSFNSQNYLSEIIIIQSNSTNPSTVDIFYVNFQETPSLFQQENKIRDQFLLDNGLYNSNLVTKKYQNPLFASADASTFTAITNTESIQQITTLGLQTAAIILGQPINYLGPNSEDFNDMDDILPTNTVNVVGLVFGLLFSIVVIIGTIIGCFYWGKYRDENSSFSSFIPNKLAGNGNNRKGPVFLGGQMGMTNYAYNQNHINLQNSHPPSYGNLSNNPSRLNTASTINTANVATYQNPWATTSQQANTPNYLSNSISSQSNYPSPNVNGAFSASSSNLHQRNNASVAGENNYDRWMDWSRKMANASS